MEWQCNGEHARGPPWGEAPRSELLSSLRLKTGCPQRSQKEEDRAGGGHGRQSHGNRKLKCQLGLETLDLDPPQEQRARQGWTVRIPCSWARHHG